MGKQVRFYMTRADEDAFIAALQGEADVVVTLNYPPTVELVALSPLPLAGPRIGDRNTFMAIYNRDIDPKLVVREFSTRKGAALDVTRSEVIQFNRCFVASYDGKLHRGRVWYDHETMQCKPKRKVFLVWAQSVLRYIKKNYRYSTDRRAYIGPDAWAQFEAGQVALAPY
jgi:hypothetical protein